MCYAVYISTDSQMNLVERNSELVRFERVTDPDSDPCIALLDFPNKWYVGSKSGCGCTFRHLHTSAVELGFSEPVDWYEEEQDELDATREFYVMLSDILSSGYHVDLVDHWEGTQPEGSLRLQNIESSGKRPIWMMPPPNVPLCLWPR